jgi:hypothetical protein
MLTLTLGSDPAAATEHRRIVTDVLSDHLAHA